MMKMGRRVLLLFAGALCITLATGCAGQAKPAETPAAQGSGGDKITITYRSWSPIEQTTKQMAAAFTAKNPNVTIDYAIFNYPEHLVDMQTRASSNTMSDIVGLQAGADVQQYRDKLMPMQDCAQKTWGADWKSKFHPIGLQQAQLGNPAGDDNYYVLPILIQTVNLWANTDILTQKGVAIPKTWDELVAAKQKLSGASYTPFLMPAQDEWMRLVVFLQIANNIAPGLPYQAEDGTAKWTDPKIVEALNYWQKFIKEVAQPGAIGLDAYPSAANAFEAGNAAMVPLGAWWMQQSDPSKTDIPALSQGMSGFEPFPFPTIPGGAAESQLVGGIDVALGITKDSKNPDMACKVLTDWIAGDGAQILINTFNDMPAVVGLNPQKFTSAKQEAMWKMFTTEWMPKVKYSRYLKDPNMVKAVGDALAAVATGESTPQQAAEAIQAAQDKKK